MKKSLAVLLAVVLAAVAWAAPAQAELGGELTRTRGVGATAMFVSTDGCLENQVAVFVSRSHEQGPDEPVTILTVNVFQMDNCLHTITLHAHTDVVIPDSEFQIDNQLGSAALNSTVTVCEPQFGGACFPVDLNLTWTGSGPLVKDRSVTHVEEPGCEIHSRFKGTSREAVATGTVVAQGTNFTPEPSVQAELAEFKSAFVMVGCEF